LAGVELWLVEWLVELALGEGELPVEEAGELSLTRVAELGVTAGAGKLTAEAVDGAALVVGGEAFDTELELVAVVGLARAVVP
jgi:hypothetical protein